jgi:hypothetical protein
VRVFERNGKNSERKSNILSVRVTNKRTRTVKHLNMAHKARHTRFMLKSS